ncbi:MAG: ABC transporter permease, partial [Terriglobales bacterium]
MWLKEIIVESWQSLARNRLRSTLTMLGITWGLVTVVLLLGYGQGVGESVLNAFLGIGNNVILSWAGQTSMQAGGERAGKRVRVTADDVMAIGELPLVKNVSPEFMQEFPIVYGNKQSNHLIRGVTASYGTMRSEHA